MCLFFFFFVVLSSLFCCFYPAIFDISGRETRDSKKKRQTKRRKTNQIPHIFMFRVTNEHKKSTKKRGKKRGTRLCAFFLRILFRCRHRHREETIIVVVTFFTSLAESPDDFDDENFGNAQERERETPSSRPQNENEKRVVFFFSRTLTVRIEKKTFRRPSLRF